MNLNKNLRFMVRDAETKSDILQCCNILTNNFHLYEKNKNGLKKTFETRVQADLVAMNYLNKYFNSSQPGFFVFEDVLTLDFEDSIYGFAVGYPAYNNKDVFLISGMNFRHGLCDLLVADFFLKLEAQLKERKFTEICSVVGSNFENYLIQNGYSTCNLGLLPYKKKI